MFFWNSLAFFCDPRDIDNLISEGERDDKIRRNYDKEDTDLNLRNKTVLYHAFPDHLSITSLAMPFYLLSLGEEDI